MLHKKEIIMLRCFSNYKQKESFDIGILFVIVADGIVEAVLY